MSTKMFTHGYEMGRKPSIDYESAMPVVMRMFWRQGYDGVRLEQIADALDVTKPTLFRTFGDKEHLFAKSVEWYYLEFIKPGEDRLAAALTLKGAVSACLHTAAARIKNELNPPGCLLTDSALSGSFTASAFVDVIARLQQPSVQLLENKIAKAQASGEVSAEADPSAILHYILAQISALSALSRSPGHKSHIDSVVEMMLGGLPWLASDGT